MGRSETTMGQLSFELCSRLVLIAKIHRRPRMFDEVKYNSRNLSQSEKYRQTSLLNKHDNP
jgi:hypothetical protein